MQVHADACILEKSIRKGPTLNRSALRNAAVAAGQALFIAVSLYLFLRGWHRDIAVPLHFSHDGLIALMQSKSTIDNGWWWFNPMLGAPFGFDALAFPLNSNVDQAIVWAVGRFVQDPIAATNLAWWMMVVLSGLFATWCMRTIGASTVSAVVAATLFALSPYALYRNIGHLWMVIYLVPFVCTAALLLATGRLHERGSGRGSGALLLAAGSALLGFNYIYYAFFGCFLLVLASFVGCLNHRSWRVLRAGGTLVVLVAVCTLLNLAPSLYSWSKHGKPVILHEKVPAESETYGLKIRQLVSPAYPHSFPPFRWWQQKEAAARFPLETENARSRLGLVATVGFLGLLGVLMAPGALQRSLHGSTLLGAGQLTLGAVLLATIGGFGSLFSLLISPEVRAWNRITPFIAFLALTAIALAMDTVAKTRKRRVISAVMVLAAGLADQRMAAIPLNAAYPGISAEMSSLRAVVGELERRLPDGAMVLQMPFRTYLYDYGVARMKAYDHVKMYLVSHRIRWSYPALSNHQLRWQQAAALLDPHRLAVLVAGEGFSAILIDRYGYADNAIAVTAAIREKLGPDDTLAETDRYLALDIRSLAADVPASTSILSAPPVPATIDMNACSTSPLIGIDSIGSSQATLSAGVVRVRGSHPLRVAGWAVDQQRASPAWGVDVVVDRTPFPSYYGFDRGDVAEHFKKRAYLASGFAAAIPVDSLRKGAHTLSVRVVSADRQCYYETPAIPIVIE